MRTAQASLYVFLLGGAAPALSRGCKGGTPDRSWLGIVCATGPDPFRHYSRPIIHLHYMPLCEVTPAGFANFVKSSRCRYSGFFYEKVPVLCAEVEEGVKVGG